MRQIRAEDGGFVLTQAAVPPLSAPDELLVRVDHAAVNGLDLVRARTGSQDLPGIEFSGTVVEAGSGVTGLSIGDPVVGLASAGALSDYVRVSSSLVLRRPDWLSGEAGGAFSQMFTIAFDAIEQAGLRPGQKALIRGANGMVGNAIVQILAGRGIETTGIVREPRAGLRQPERLLIAAELPNSLKNEWDVVFECVGPEHLDEDIRLSVPTGTIVLIGAIGALDVTVDFLQLMLKRIVLRGTTFSSRPVDDKRLVIGRMADEVLPLLERGELTVPVYSVHPPEEIVRAVQTMVAGSTAGKVLIRMA